MSANIYVGGAAEVAQVSTVTPGGTIESGDIFTVTLTDELGNATTVTFTATATTVKNVVEGLQAAMVAAKATSTPWGKVTATEDDAAVTITADTAGVPFTVAVATTETGGGAADDQTIVTATTTACSGPAVYSAAENWYLSAVPIAGDDVIIPATFSGTIYGYDASGVALNSFTVEEGCTAAIGSRDKPLQIDLADSKNYYLNGTGETWLAITGASANVRIGAAGSASGNGTYGLNLRTGETGMVVDVRCESTNERVGLAAGNGHTGTFTTIKIGGGYVKIGSGVTATSATWTGGEVHSEASIATQKQAGGEGHIEGANAATTLTVEAGKSYEKSTGTKGHVYIKGTGIVDCDQSGMTRTWTDTDISGGGKLIDKERTITHTNPITCDSVTAGGPVDKGGSFNVTYAAAS